MRLVQFLRTLWPFGADNDMEPPALGPEMLEGMLRGIMTTRPDEIDCDECFERLDEFTELVLAGKDIPEAMELVEDHLNRCPDCREEFEALLEALQAVQD